MLAFKGCKILRPLAFAGSSQAPGANLDFLEHAIFHNGGLLNIWLPFSLRVALRKANIIST